MPYSRSNKKKVPIISQRSRTKLGELTITGGRLRGRKLLYPQGAGTRPMKHRVRQAVFNRIGDAMEGKHALDLFAGSGALGLEAISRGAARATLIECHVPTAQILRQNVAALDTQDRAQVLTTSAFLLARQQERLPTSSWLVFCSPPYDFYVDRQQEMITLIGQLVEKAPAESIFVVEADKRFDFSRLPAGEAWETRTYPPAVVGILRVSGTTILAPRAHV